jgi:hypothetical protein
MSETFFGRLFYWPDAHGLASGVTVADRADVLDRIIRAEGPLGRNAAFDTWPLHPRSISILALELAVYAATHGEALPPTLVNVLAWCMGLPADFRDSYVRLRSEAPKKGRPGGVDNASFKVLMIDMNRKLECGEVFSTRGMQAELKRQYGATVARSHIDAIRSQPEYAEAVHSVGLNQND